MALALRSLAMAVPASSQLGSSAARGGSYHSWNRAAWRVPSKACTAQLEVCGRNVDENSGCEVVSSRSLRGMEQNKLAAGTAATDSFEKDKPSDSMLLQVSPVSILALATLPGADQVAALFGSYIELVRSWDLPEWLIHWGHPGNMAVVLFAMGGYGTYLGWQIRLGTDMALKAKAKDLHPKLFAGVFFFFAAGATGGIVSLLTQGKPIFESPHALTGFIGLALLGVQSTLTAFFEGNSDLRGVHAWLGSGIMALFLVHSAFGLQLGLGL